MTDDKIDNLTKEVYELKGNVNTLVTLVGVYQTVVSKLEGRIWSALILGGVSFGVAIFTFLLSRK